MIPGKYRSVSGRAANNVNCGLHLVIQTSSLPEKNKVEFKLNKDTSSFPGRLLQHDLERNYSSRQGDHINLVSSSLSSFPILQRSSEEKILYSDRLSLERQKLTVCPIINGEDHLRLLNFQHNFITRIQNISNLQKLISLDLYDNQIEEISGLSTLRCLRVLLLGKNRIKKISNLENLKSLDVLDLHGNQITKIENINHLCELRVLNLARNFLSHVDNLNGLDSLTELNLRHNQITFVRDVDNLPCLQHLFLSFNNISRPLDSGLNNALQGLSVIDTYLVEVDGDTLSLYGSGALESLDRNWSVQTAGMITTVSFTFIEFDEIVHVLPKLKIKFPNSLHLKFKETNLVMLQQFNALAQLRRVDQLTIDPQGNPVVNFTLWKYYVLFRLSHFSMQKINGTEVTQNDMIMAERLFGILAHVASSELPQYRLISILGDARKKQFRYLLESKGKKPGIINEENNDSKRLVGENTNRATLNYTTRDFYNEKLEEIKEKKKFCKTYIEDLVKEATEINMKNEALQKLWPQMFIELVRDAVIEIRNKNSYMKLCLQQITDQK
ncbi:leucine-rich repeat-containing protein 49 isoform X5 [Macaca fascicularis]|uniref:leucine-rich repeat-containing protein 49 isoform X5 n=1 Tax=Macaca fascicularis TaxID=9541 RepID=UPI0032B03B93